MGWFDENHWHGEAYNCGLGYMALHMDCHTPDGLSDISSLDGDYCRSEEEEEWEGGRNLDVVRNSYKAPSPVNKIASLLSARAPLVAFSKIADRCPAFANKTLSLESSLALYTLAPRSSFVRFPRSQP